jgi:D-xylose 1-dehydrogenase (NADP+, D-xylono-1,5-lactone-forming)
VSGVSWGILGAARIARRVADAVRSSPVAQFVAVAARDAARAEAFARETGIPRSYGSYEQLLDDSEVEAIYVAVPNALHVEWSIRALEAGKHVLCEKPLALRSDDASRVFDAAESHGLLAAEAYMFRHHPQTRLVEQLVAGGAVGRVRVLRGEFAYDLLELLGPDDIRLRPELDGGSLADVGCYCVSGSRLLCGEPERVFGEAVMGPTGVDTAFAGTLRMCDDVLVQFRSAFDVPRRQSLEIVGEEGALVVEAPWRRDWPGGIFLERNGGRDEIPHPRGDAFRLEVEDLSLAIRGQAEPLLRRADAVAQARVLEALLQSASRRRAVDLSPAPAAAAPA